VHRRGGGAASPRDYDFALELYLDGTQRLLTALGRWDEAAVVARFEKSFKPEQAQVIRSDGADIGWMQVSESASGFHLHQLHLVDNFRNRGIGTHLIEVLLDRARGMEKPVALNVIRRQSRHSPLLPPRLSCSQRGRRVTPDALGGPAADAPLTRRPDF
jgi:GNAT superfamily N-acetyltransferase